MLLQQIFLLTITLVAAVTITPPLGRYRVSSRALLLTDENRPDPFDPQHHSRRLMLSIFQPVPKYEPCHLQEVSYMPPSTAAAYDEMYAAFGVPNGTFGSLEMEFCEAIDSGESLSPFYVHHRPYPVVVFSPGLGNSRLLYTAMATSLSSQGFVVVAIDHPYDANIVEFPDGSVVRAANISSEEQIVNALKTRTEDVLFVVDQLPTHSPRPKTLTYGHSLGGATAAAAMMNDHRISGGVNLDGDFFDPFVKPGLLDCPFMLVGRENKTIHNDESWRRLWPRLRSTKVDVEVEGFAHGSFTDLPFLVEELGLTGRLPGEARELLGSVDGVRGLEIVTGVVADFLRFAMGWERAPMAGRLQKAYSEVELVEEVRRGRCKCG